MPRLVRILGLNLAMAAGCLVVQAQTPRVAPPAGDVYQSGNATDDRAKYVHGNWFDRCSYERDHISENPYTKQYGLPDHVPIDREIMNQYVRCAVDSCAVNEKAVCWGKKSVRGPAPGDQFLTSLLNCLRNSADEVTCDLKPLPALPAVCFADTTATCGQPKVVFQLKATRGDIGGGATQYGQTLPEMFGTTDFQNQKIKIHLPAGQKVGNYYKGPVERIPGMNSNKFKTFAGTIEDSSTFKVTGIWDFNNRPVAGVSQTPQYANGREISKPLPVQLNSR